MRRTVRSSMSSETEGAFSLDLTADVREMRDWLHEFAEKVIRPAAAEWDEREETPWPILEEAAKIGLYSLDGSGLAAIAVSSNGTSEQIGEWLPQIFGSPGDIKLGAFCSSEADAGSDVGAIRTRASYEQATDEWVLDGTKTWAANGGIAGVHVVCASGG